MKNEMSHSAIYAAIAGMCCIFVGLRLGRFAYTPMVPALVNHHWLSIDGAGYLGSFNFLGYFIGAITVKRLLRLASSEVIIKVSLLLLSISLMACAWNEGYVWLNVWRFLAGIAMLIGFMAILWNGLLNR